MPYAGKLVTFKLSSIANGDVGKVQRIMYVMIPQRAFSVNCVFVFVSERDIYKYIEAKTLT